MKRRVDRWLRSPRGTWTVGGLVLLVAVLLGLGQGLGWWHLTDLLGTASPDTGRAPELVQRVSLSRVGGQGNSDSFAPSISADGRFVTFLSTADNLVPEDENELQDVFLYDLTSDEITRISEGHDGAEANGKSSAAAISRDGQFIVFVSEANNLVADDTNDYEDVFVYDRQRGTTARISVGHAGQQGNDRSLQPSISGDGRFVAFVSLADNLLPEDNNGMSDIFVYDRLNEALELTSVGSDGQRANHTSKYPVISAGGRYVAFQSKAANLVSGDDNSMYDIFVHDRREGVTELISRSTSGGAANFESQRPSLSADGRYVAFESWADDLVDEDTNSYSDVFVVDRQTGAVELISVNNEGAQANDVNGGTVLSDDGRYVAFSSRADNLSSSDNNQLFDVYVHDRRGAETSLISLGLDGQAGNGTSISPSLTTSGTYVVFDSVAGDLVADDTNNRVDVFVFDALAGVEYTHVINLPLLLR